MWGLALVLQRREEAAQRRHALDGFVEDELDRLADIAALVAAGWSHHEAAAAVFRG